MVKFEFYMSDEYFDRLSVLKKKMGKDEMTYNEFAKDILQNQIYRMQPQRPTEEELENC